jgi:hypothetical protein
MLGLVVYQPSEMVNHFLPAPPAPPAKPPDRDKLIINWLDSSFLEEKPSMPSRLCACNHIQPRPSTRYNKQYGLTRPSCLVLTLAVNLLVILTCASTAGAVRSEPDIANPNYQYLKFEGGPTLIFNMFFNLVLFRLYGVMFRGCTHLEAVGLVCNFSGKLLTGTFSGQAVQFFLQPPCLETSDDEFFPLYSNNKCLCIVLSSWRSEAVKSYFIIVPEQSLKTVEEKGGRVPNP